MPKPFSGRMKIIQTNAIGSWIQLTENIEIILMGDEEGTTEIVDKFGLKHIPDIAKSKSGVPLIDSIFNKAVAAAKNKIVCYVNADIILMSDFITAAKLMIKQKSKFLAIGKRWDVGIEELLDFNVGWEQRLKNLAKNKGNLHSHTGIDYFLFTKGLYENIPPFSIGRFSWDQWLVYDVVRRGLPVVDCTNDVFVVHQNHDYNHLGQSAKQPGSNKDFEYNLRIAGGVECCFTIRDSQYGLKDGKLQKRFDPVYATYRWMISTSKMSNFLRPVVIGLKNAIRGI